jgi:hypothetical protein
MDRRLGQQQVICHGQIRDQADFLEGGTQTERMGGAGAREVDRGAEYRNCTGIGPCQSAQDLDQRRFAGSVLPQQRMDLAGANLK